MDRLEVAFVLTQLLEEADRVNSLKINDIQSVQWKAAEIVSQYISKYWWGVTGPGLILQTAKNYTDNCFDIVPTKQLQAFINYVIENKDGVLVPDLLKHFPLIEPIQSVYVQNINEPVYG